MEPNKRMRSSSDDVGLDRLSVMPDQVLVHILSYMSTRDAVRTMLLRCFGNLWTFIPALSFDFGDYYVRPVNDNADDGVNGVDDDVEDDDNDDDEDDDNDDDEDDDGEDDDDDDDNDVDDKDDDDDAERAIIGEAYLRFFSYVRNVLRLHRRSTIDSFHLYIKDFKNGQLDPSLTSDVHEWLKFATDRGVKDLHVSCNLFNGLTLPCCVFTSQSIVTLTLSGCSFEKYEHQPQLHMGALRSLNLNWLNIIYESNEALNEFISRCTSLQNLDIYCAVGLHDLNITAPNLPRLGVCFLNDPDIPCTLTCPHVKTLNIAFNGSFGSSPYVQLDVIDISSLEVVNLANIPKGPSSTTQAFLRQFRDVEVFTLASQGFEQLCLLEKMQIAPNKWQRMLLEPRWNHERCLDVIIKLVKSSLELEELIIDYRNSSANGEVVSSESATSCVIPRLKHVTMRGRCCEGQLQLIEFILRNAVVLEELVINWEKDFTILKELDFVRRVSRVKRASVNAIVHFDS